MKSRVTITLSPELHRSAKRVARTRRTTVSGLIEKSLGNVVFHAGLGDTALVDALIGSAELRSRALGEDPLYDALFEKYLNPSKQHARTH